MINKLLITCLQRNKRLVIPTLGAFIRKNIEGVGVILVFVPFLNKDDGVLCSAIKSWAGVDDDEAAQILEEYIVAVKKSLDDRGQYIIEGVGVLKYDTNRIIYLAKESEAVKEEVTKLIVEQKPEPAVVEQKPEPAVVEPKQEPVVEESKAVVVEPTTVSAPISTPIPTPAPIVNTELKRAVEVAESAAQEDNEPVKEPQIPQYNRPVYDRPTQSTDMGTRYFSPVRRDEEVSPSVDSKENEVVNQNYGHSQQRESGGVLTQQQNRYRDPQQRISNIYGSSNGVSTPPPITRQQSGDRAVTSPQRSTRAPKKKKGNDMVLWVAIIAVVLTVMVLIYGYIYGGEQTIDTEALIEQVQSESAASAAGSQIE